MEIEKRINLALTFWHRSLLFLIGFIFGIVSGFLLCVTIVGNAKIDNVDIMNEENFESSERW